MTSDVQFDMYHHEVTKASCRGTIGEFLQGPMEIGNRKEICIVSAVSSLRSTVTFRRTAAGAHGNGRADGLAGRARAAAAINALSRLAGIEMPRGTWAFKSELPVGCGMASSTADIVAVLRCASEVIGFDLNEHHVASILNNIEYSDSVFIQETCLFMSETHEVVETFPNVPCIYSGFVVENYCVDTQSARIQLWQHYRINEQSYQSLMNDALQAFRSSSASRICEIARRSAELSQAVFPKRSFAIMQRHMRNVGADGIIVAHTGSVAGLLFCSKPSLGQVRDITSLFSSLGYGARFARIAHDV